jgi:hypothetical protein
LGVLLFASVPVLGLAWLRIVTAAAADLALSDEEVARLGAPYLPHPVVGHS